jgi:hypothetical protein
LSDKFEFGEIPAKVLSRSFWESVSSGMRGIDRLKLTAETDLGSAMVNDKAELETEDPAVLFSEGLQAVTGILAYDCEVTERAG